MNISERLLPEFDHEFGSTRKFLALVPDDRLTWKPHEKSMELGRLAWHLSSFTDRVFDVLTKPARIVSAEGFATQKAAWAGKTREAILANYDAQLAPAREALTSLTDAAWDEPWQLKIGDRVLLDIPRYQAYRFTVMSHQTHHRAQLGVYFRLNGISLPSVYGPSADES